jgi:hypothetical protein
VGTDRERRRTGRHTVGANHDAKVARDELRAAGFDRELPIDQIGVADEVGEKARRRLLVELVRRALLRDASAFHHDDAIGDGERFLLVVRDVDDGERERLLQLADLLPHAAAQLRVEVRQRLVEEQHRRLEHERARDRDALLLAARELGGQSRLEPREAEHRELRVRELLRLRLVHAHRHRAVSTFPAIMCGNSAYDWNTMLTLRSFAARSVTSVSPIKMRPPDTDSSPATIRSVVVLPQPEGPSSVTSSAGSTRNDTSSTAVTSP